MILQASMMDVATLCTINIRDSNDTSLQSQYM